MSALQVLQWELNEFVGYALDLTSYRCVLCVSENAEGVEVRLSDRSFGQLQARDG